MRYRNQPHTFDLTATAILVAWLSTACAEVQPDATRATSQSNSEQAALTTEAAGDTSHAFAGENTPLSLGVGRTSSTAVWDTLWQKRGTFDDTLLLQPLELHAMGAIVFVNDYGNKNVQAFDAETGEKLWSAGRRGQGPTEFLRMSLFSASDSLLGVADPLNQRISFVSMQGQFEGGESVTFPGSLQGICKLGSHWFVAGSETGRARLLKWTPGSKSLALHQPEWLSYLDTMNYIVAQFSLRRIDDGRCVLRHSVGPQDLLIFDSLLTLTDRVPPRERVRAGIVDTITRGNSRGYGIAKGSGFGWGDPAVADGALFIWFRGASALRERVIDEFNMSDFSYVGTHVAPHVLKGLAGDADHLTLLMEDAAGYYVITQLRRRASR